MAKTAISTEKETQRMTRANDSSEGRNSLSISVEEELERMRNVDVRTVDRDSLTDIRDVKVNDSLPREERVLDFIRQIGNPYCYKVDDIVVKVSFAGKCSLEDAVKDCILAGL